MQKKKILAGIATAALVASSAVALAACSANNSTTTSSSSSKNTSESASSPSAASQSATASSAGAAIAEKGIDVAELAASLFTTPDEVISFGDYDGMATLAKKIQNGEMDGKIVKIEGLVSQFATGMSYNIVEEKADGTSNIGTTFVIEGDNVVYPNDKDRVVITGKIMADESGLVYSIHTVPECVQVLA